MANTLAGVRAHMQERLDSVVNFNAQGGNALQAIVEKLEKENKKLEEGREDLLRQ